MDWKKSLDHYLTTPPDDTVWDAIDECLSEEFFDKYESKGWVRNLQQGTVEKDGKSRYFFPVDTRAKEWASRELGDPRGRRKG